MQDRARRRRSNNIDPESTPPPTPRMRDLLPSFVGILGRSGLPSASHDTDGDDEALDVPRDTTDREWESMRELRYEGSTLDNRERRRLRREGRILANAQSSLSEDSREQAEVELANASQRRSRSQNDPPLGIGLGLSYLLAPPAETREHAAGDDGAVSLKPLTPLSSAPKQQVKTPTVARRRSINIAKVDAGRVNELHKEENERMTEDPMIRNYAKISQEGLYGAFGIDDMAHTPMLQRYLEPSRDADEICRQMRDMTVNDHKYRVDGPPEPVNIYNIDYLTDVSEVHDYADFREARKAKAFAGYVMFTERQEEINMLQRMQDHGYLKDGVEIKHGYQEIGPHGAVAWLTYEGQEIGGRQREEYEREKADEGKSVIFLFVSMLGRDQGDRGSRYEVAHGE